jgi:predicted transcriptional regulator YdeE
MIEIKVPEWSYVRTTHYKGNNVQKTYHDLHHWLDHNGFNGLREAGVQYYEPYTPIKHEYYPIDRDPKDPHFEIYIPIVKK